MPAIDHMTLPFTPDTVFHIFNRSASNKLLFRKPRNYAFFMKQFMHYLGKYTDLYGWCLLPNHFHIMIKTNSTEAILNQAKIDFKIINRRFFQRKEIHPLVLSRQIDASQQEINAFINNLSDELHDFIIEQLVEWILSERFRRFVLSYAKAFNKQEGLYGSLFQKLIRRKSLYTINDFKQLLQYIHHNPIHHFYSKSYDDYPYTSFHDFSSGKYSVIDKDTVLSWFGGSDGFVQQHAEYARRKRNLYLE